MVLFPVSKFVKCKLSKFALCARAYVLEIICLG